MVDARAALDATRRLAKRTPIVTAQELNRQAKRSKTLLVRGMGSVLGVKPQKRLRRRVVIPKGGRAKPGRLAAIGLSLVETMPARWFAKGRRGRGGGLSLSIPGGASVRNNRPTAGQPFRATMPNGKTLVMRRVNPAKTRVSDSGPTWLPIQEMMIDTSVPGYAVRSDVLQTLAKEWPAVWQKRMKREIKRAFG